MPPPSFKGAIRILGGPSDGALWRSWPTSITFADTELAAFAVPGDRVAMSVISLTQANSFPVWSVTAGWTAITAQATSWDSWNQNVRGNAVAPYSAVYGDTMPASTTVTPLAIGGSPFPAATNWGIILAVYGPAPVDVGNRYNDSGVMVSKPTIAGDNRTVVSVYGMSVGGSYGTNGVLRKYERDLNVTNVGIQSNVSAVSDGTYWWMAATAGSSLSNTTMVRRINKTTLEEREYLYPCGHVAVGSGSSIVHQGGRNVIACDGGFVYVFGHESPTSTYKLTKFVAATGAVVWTYDTGSTVGRGQIVYANGFVWVYRDATTSVARINANTGVLESTIPVAGTCVDMLVIGNKLFVLTSSQTTYRIDTSVAPGTETATPYAGGGAIGSSNGYLVTSTLPSGTFPPQNVTTNVWDPNGSPASAIGVGFQPVAVAYDGTHVWATEGFGSAPYVVARVNATTGAVIGTTTVGTTPRGIIYDGTTIWVTNSGSNSVTRIDPSTGSVLSTTAVGSTPYGLAVVGSQVWTANAGAGTLTRLNAAGTVVGTVSTGGSGPQALAYDGTNVWVAHSGSSTVQRVNGVTGALVGSPIAVANASSIVYGGAAVWVGGGTSTTSSVTRIDATTGVVTNTYSLAGAVTSLAFGGSYLWVTRSSSSTLANAVVKIDPVTLTQVGSPILLGGASAQGMVSDGTQLWVANSNSSHLQRVNMALGSVSGRVYSFIGRHHGIGNSNGTTIVSTNQDGTGPIGYTGNSVAAVSVIRSRNGLPLPLITINRQTNFDYDSAGSDPTYPTVSTVEADDIYVATSRNTGSGAVLTKMTGGIPSHPTGYVAQPIGGSRYGSMCQGAGSFWLERWEASNTGNFTIQRVDSTTGNLLASIVIGPYSSLPDRTTYRRLIVFDGSSVWVFHGSRTFKINPATNTVTEITGLPSVGGAVEAIAAAGSVWVVGATSEFITLLLRIDPTTNTGSINADLQSYSATRRGLPVGLAAEGGNVYVVRSSNLYAITTSSNGITRTIYRIDPSTNTGTEVYMNESVANFPSRPTGFVLCGSLPGQIWITTNTAGRTGVSNGSLRIDRFNTTSLSIATSGYGDLGGNDSLLTAWASAYDSTRNLEWVLTGQGISVNQTATGNSTHMFHVYPSGPRDVAVTATGDVWVLTNSDGGAPALWKLDVKLPGFTAEPYPAAGRRAPRYWIADQEFPVGPGSTWTAPTWLRQAGPSGWAAAGIWTLLGPGVVLGGWSIGTLEF